MEKKNTNTAFPNKKFWELIKNVVELILDYIRDLAPDANAMEVLKLTMNTVNSVLASHLTLNEFSKNLEK